MITGAITRNLNMVTSKRVEKQRAQTQKTATFDLCDLQGADANYFNMMYAMPVGREGNAPVLILISLCVYRSIKLNAKDKNI